VPRSRQRARGGGRRQGRRGHGAVGAVAADPDNSAQLVALTSSAALPIGFPIQISGTVAYGLNRQNQSFVPLTVNPALTPAPLPAGDLDGDVRPLLANFLLVSRPLPKLEVRGRYRLRDYDNHSDEILFTQTSNSDAALATETKHSFAPSYTTQNASLETRYRIDARDEGDARLRWDRWNRGPEREVRQMDEYTPEVRLDTRAGPLGADPHVVLLPRPGRRPVRRARPFRVLEPGVARPRSPRRSASTTRPRINATTSSCCPSSSQARTPTSP
jgi:hypothetical protein